MNKEGAINKARTMYLEQDYSLQSTLEWLYDVSYNKGYEDCSVHHISISDSDSDLFNV